MTQNNALLIDDLNQLLKGTHMGSSVFKEYLTKAQNNELKTILSNALDVFNRHEVELTKHITRLNGDAADSLGIMGTISDFIEKMKTMVIDTDAEILTHAIDAIDMGLKQSHEFIQKQLPLEEMVKNAVTKLESDYKMIYQQLSDYRIQIQ